MYLTEAKRNIYYEKEDRMRDRVTQDYEEIELDSGQKVLALVVYHHGKKVRHIAPQGGRWLIIEDKKVIAELEPQDLVALRQVGEVLPEYNERLELYETIKAKIK